MHVVQAGMLVALGGGAGALTRFGGVSGINHLAELAGVQPGDRFPLGTLVVNVAGCLVIGVIMGLHQPADGTRTFGDTTRLLVMIGFLGSLTTFSTFGAETIRLLEEQRAGLAFLNIGANVLLGLAAVGLGLFVARAIASG